MTTFSVFDCLFYTIYEFTVITCHTLKEAIPFENRLLYKYKSLILFFTILPDFCHSRFCSPDNNRFGWCGCKKRMRAKLQRNKFINS